MQNKGAIKIFAILLALACIFYLSFTVVTNNVEGDAKAYAENVVNSNKYSTKDKDFKDDLKTELTDPYLDSMKKITVYDILIADYTYEECKKNAINLGLDLRGGMNVTLEVSVMDIIRNLSNDNQDPAFKAALADAQKNLGVNNNDSYITLFERSYRRIAPNGHLAPLFQSIENKNRSVTIPAMKK